MFTTLITGANRGIGLTLTSQYLADGWQVNACSREANHAALTKLAKQYPKQLTLHTLDVTNAAQINTLASALKGTPIDVLINNAGTYPDSDFGHSDVQDWLHAFHVNSIAPLKMAEALFVNIAAGQLKKIVTLSSKMGSIEDNTSGGSYLYRTSKTAANMVMKSLSIDLKPHGIACCVLHPGWVLTDMGGPNALINTEQSATGLRKVIAELNLDNSGRFIAYDGKVIPW